MSSPTLIMGSFLLLTLAGCAGGGGGGGGGGEAGPPSTGTRTPLGVMANPEASVSASALDPVVPGTEVRFELVVGAGLDAPAALTQVQARLGVLFAEDPTWTPCLPTATANTYVVTLRVPTETTPGMRLIVSSLDARGDTHESSIDELRLP